MKRKNPYQYQFADLEKYIGRNVNININNNGFLTSKLYNLFSTIFNVETYSHMYGKTNKNEIQANVVFELYMIFKLEKNSYDELNIIFKLEKDHYFGKTYENKIKKYLNTKINNDIRISFGSYDTGKIKFRSDFMGSLKYNKKQNFYYIPNNIKKENENAYVKFIPGDVCNFYGTTVELL